MFKHIWSIVCREAIVNADSNSLSLSDVLEGIDLTPTDNSNQVTINTENPLSLPLTYEVVSFISRDKADKLEELTVIVDFVSPAGKSVIDFNAKAIFELGATEMRNRLKIQGMTLVGEGTYTFNVYLEKKNIKNLVATIPFKVSLSQYQSEVPS